MRSARLLRVLTCVAAIAVSSGCSDPPTREIHLAQGAIDAARAAGADTYASEELDAAITALQQGEAAIDQRDYRLALSHAIDSRERAQLAAKLAADGKAAARSQAEGLLADVTSALALATVTLQAGEASRAPRTRLAPLRQAIADGRAAVDEAGKALATQDYLGATSRLRGVAETVRAADTAFATDSRAAAGRTRRAPR
jgi:Domain of unknown function (DUF4398)